MPHAKTASRWSGFPDDLRIIDYDTSLFAFREWFAEILKLRKLEQLHRKVRASKCTYLADVEKVRKKCESAGAELVPMIGAFLAMVVTPISGKLMGWQAPPTMRCHLAVRDPSLKKEIADFPRLTSEQFLARHYPGLHTFHRDFDIGLQEGAINLWVPVVDVSGTNSLWLGTPGRRGLDAKPLQLKYGQAILFDGCRRFHGTVWNTSGISRLSFDLRLFPGEPGARPSVGRPRRSA